ncbi:MAG: hypothetical protein FJW34_01750 [Acidobacteria bacterium]|nr:hypothetical protein [Acidobacteriota bacterium]
MRTRRISASEATAIARNAAAGKVNLQEGSPVRVDHREDRYVVTFVHLLPPGIRGPDYDAEVTIDDQTGEVLKLLGGS